VYNIYSKFFCVFLLSLSLADDKLSSIRKYEEEEEEEEEETVEEASIVQRKQLTLL
jgi:hypothetical protein